jgi:hypothetical protein
MKHVIGIALLATLLSSCVNLGPITGGSLSTPAPRTVSASAAKVAQQTNELKPVLHVAPAKRIALHAAVILGQMGDALSTDQQIKRGAVELNPLLRQVVHHPAYMFSLKAVVAGWNIYEAEKMYRQGNPSWWKGEAAGVVIGWGAFAWNERQVFIHDRNEHRKVGLTP